MNLHLPYITGLLGNGLAVILAAVAAPVSGVHAQSPAARPPVPGAPAGVTAFVDVAVIPMDTERVLRGQTVLVQGGRITALGPVNQVKVPAGAVRIDGRGQYLIPGLADMHVHIGLWKRRGAKPPYDSASAERRLFLWLANGVTTVRNMDYLHPENGKTRLLEQLDPTLALRLRARAAAGELLSPRIYTSGPWAPKQYIGQHTAGEAPSGIVPRLDSIPAYVAAYKAAGYDFIKIHDEESVELLDSLTTAARRLGIPVAGHPWGGIGGIGIVGLNRADDLGPEKTLAWAARQGLASMEHLEWSLPESPDSARLRALAAATQRAGIWHCPTLIVRRTDNPVAPLLVKALHDAGAGLLLGTDAPLFPSKSHSGWPHGDPGDAHRELQALVRAGLTPYQALVVGTRNTAAFFKTLDETGTIAVGKRADLVLLPRNPLQDIGNTARPAGVMIGGRWLSREEIDRRLADFPTEERGYFYWRVVERLQELYWNSGGAEAEALFGGLGLTAAQRTAFGQLRTAHEEQWTTLTDSLMGAAAHRRPDLDLGQAGTEQVLHLVARQLGEYRAALSPEQRKVFDPKARAWVQTYEQQGYRPEIPDIKK